jgi:hypothetical protein
MKIRWLLPLVWLAVIFATIGVSQVAGWWEVSGRPDVAASAPATVTGQQTLRQVAEANHLELATLIAESGLPAGVDPGVPLRTLRDTVPGFEMQQVRDAVDRLR